MDYKVIEETRNYYIEKHGKPIETKMGSFTYKFVNGHLEAFDRLINSMSSLVDRIDIFISEKLVVALCEYCKLEQPENLNRIADKLNSIMMEMNKKVNFSKSKFLNLIKELSDVIEDKNFNPNAISNYFSYYLNVKFIGNEKFNYRNYDKLGNPFRGRNNGLNN